MSGLSPYRGSPDSGFQRPPCGVGYLKLEEARRGLERGGTECDSSSVSPLGSDLCWPWHWPVARTTASSSTQGSNEARLRRSRAFVFD